ncbi:hypothetical protein [Borreliella garinii]|uniref:hypothetical protein n=1 Tax=Borreliella garinii TaxID=29519 RepID=UPI003F7C85FB
MRAIKDQNNNLIQDLKGLSYTYYTNDNNYKIWGKEVLIAKIIAFESTQAFLKKKNMKLKAQS